MSDGFRHPALQQFVDDELLRAPLLFDQVVDGTLENLQASLPGQPPGQRQITGDLMTALKAQRWRLAEYHMRSLRKQLQDQAVMPRSASAEASQPRRGHLSPTSQSSTSHPRPLSLVDEAEVAVDVELSHAVEAIRSVAEYELRELQTYVSALVGDMDMARDHNPFRAETHAHALWAAAQGLTLSHGHQVAFMRHASAVLAQQLRRSYAASSSRLEAMGIEPAAYRTLILPAGSRRSHRGHGAETTLAPDLRMLRDTAPGALDAFPTARAGDITRRAHPASAVSSAAAATVDLASRLFEAMQTEDRTPGDIAQVLARLQGPAMRLARSDSSLLDAHDHPLWRFVNRVGFEGEMAPDPADPERAQLLKLAHEIIDQISAEAVQNSGLYRWALDRLDAFVSQRTARRLAAAAVHIRALQALERRLDVDNDPPTTLHGMLDVPQLDTVPADLMAEETPTATAPGSTSEAERWLASLRPGERVRLFLQGRWVRARLLWPSERREIWLFADGASDESWAVRRGALLMLHDERLAKTLRPRNLVASAAARLQAQMADRRAA